MDCCNGKVMELDESSLAEMKAHNKRLVGLTERMVRTPEREPERTVAELTQEEADFFQSKGVAFRMLWGGKFAKGLTAEERDQLATMVRASKSGLEVAGT